MEKDIIFSISKIATCKHGDLIGPWEIWIQF